MIKKKFTNIQTLYELVCLKKDVYAEDLRECSTGFYKDIKSIGISRINATYIDENEHTIVLKGLDIPAKIRALSGHCNRMYFRFDDTESMRLEEHYGLTVPINTILADTGIISNSLYKNHSIKDVACMSFEDVIQAYIH